MIDGTINNNISRNSWPVYESLNDFSKPTGFQTDGLIYMDIKANLVFTKDDEPGKQLIDLVNKISKEIYNNRNVNSL